MPLIAHACSDSVRANTGHNLPFTIASTRDIDMYLGEIRDQEGGSNDLAELVFKFGSYLGELLVRHAGARWVEPPAELGGWPGVELPGGTFGDPIGKAFKRVDNGPEDSVVSFIDVTMELARGTPKRRWFKKDK
ncbi:hypothetical protein BTZ20_0361 [Rhodococcus sp. MTM3W5.2]|uniref:hypothetical protein n=1 Tax=Rhodococcus sp. MTM3W5.2 TaxID=1805827 RepID=UPI0009793A42|nr:hypothetical protein [Rhodococcus sp. MTM3W5.2]AQA25814.1 hypothetical protein BTZ20_0361 [Rhodococcus sp. MTM3W5.2]